MSSYTFKANDSDYRVTLHNTYTQDKMGKWIVRYSMRRLSDGVILFAGRDLHASPLDKPTGKSAALALLSFLTLREGDTDSDYFDDYTPAQLAFRDSSDCEELQSYTCED